MTTRLKVRTGHPGSPRPPPKPPVPKAREVTTLVLTHPDTLTEDGKVLAKELRGRCPELNVLCELIEAFAEMLVNRSRKTSGR